MCTYVFDYFHLYVCTINKQWRELAPKNLPSRHMTWKWCQYGGITTSRAPTLVRRYFDVTCPLGMLSMCLFVYLSIGLSGSFQVLFLSNYCQVRKKLYTCNVGVKNVLMYYVRASRLAFAWMSVEVSVCEISFDENWQSFSKNYHSGGLG